MQLGLRAPHPLLPSLDELERALSFGCTCLEIEPSLVLGSRYPRHQAEALLVHRLRHAGLDLVSWAVDSPLVSPAAEQESVQDRVALAIGLAARVQRQLPGRRPAVVVARSGSIAEYPELEEVAAWRQLVHTTRRLATMAANLGVRFAVVPKRADLVENATGARRLVDEVACEALGLCLDPAYIYWSDDDLDEMSELLREYVLLARLKDLVLVRDGMWLKGYPPFGRGQMDTVRCMRLIENCPHCAGAIVDCVETVHALREVVALVRRGGHKDDAPAVSQKSAPEEPVETDPAAPDPQSGPGGGNGDGTDGPPVDDEDYSAPMKSSAARVPR